jgi:UDPglucose 6-dehydrogenase
MNNITVIGIGRLGLCLALCFSKKYNILGVDINDTYVKQLNDKTFKTLEPHVNNMLHATETFEATSNIYNGVNYSDIIFILVDTPGSGDDNCYDVKNLNTVLQQINLCKIDNKHIIIGCTVMPGYIANIGNELIKDCTNTTLSYNPEFIQQGNIVNGFLNPDMILIGTNNKITADILINIYENVCENKPIFNIMSPISAEICKLDW